MDGQPLSKDDNTEVDPIWRRRIAEAARRAADDLAGENDPSLRRLHADLTDLAARMTSEDTDIDESGDPRRVLD